MKRKSTRFKWLVTMETIFHLELVACFVRERHGRRGVRQFYRSLAPLVR